MILPLIRLKQPSIKITKKEMSIGNYKLRPSVKAYREQLRVEYFTILYMSLHVLPDLHDFKPYFNVFVGYDRNTRRITLY